MWSPNDRAGCFRARERGDVALRDFPGDVRPEGFLFAVLRAVFLANGFLADFFRVAGFWAVLFPATFFVFVTADFRADLRATVLRPPALRRAGDPRLVRAGFLGDLPVMAAQSCQGVKTA